MKNWPKPKNVKEFLGFFNYHRDHVKNFADYVEPLHKLVSKQSEYKWTDQHQEAFKNLKDTDASDKCIGAELSQVQDGIENTICFASKVLTPQHRKYCTTRKELLSIVVFTRQFRHFY